jgi:hypothetical protein
MTRAELLAAQVLETKPLLTRFLVGFNNVTHVRQTPDLPNHLAWTLGHLALTMHRVASLLEGKPWSAPALPEPAPGTDTHPSIPASFAPKDFVTGHGEAGSRDRGVIDTEAVAFGSKPEERHDRYPSLERCQQIYANAADRLAEVVRSLPDDRLDAPITWGNAQMPAWSLITRMVFHNGMHTGQIVDLRRALGFKSIF